MKGRYFSMALMGRKIAAIRAYVVEGGGADYHDQSAEHWIVKQIATPMSIYPEYKATRTSFGINALKDSGCRSRSRQRSNRIWYHNRWISGSMAGYESSGSFRSW